MASVLSALAMPPSHVMGGLRTPLTARDGRQRALLQCRGAFFVVTHRAGWPLPQDEAQLRELLAQIFLRLAPEWPDGLPAYPIARPAGHPVSRLLQEGVFRRTAAELAHHWEVMGRRFGQRPPPVVGSARLLLRLIARQPGAVGILTGEELPAPAFWPQAVRIAAILAPPAIRKACARPLREAVHLGADRTAAAASSPLATSPLATSPQEARGRHTELAVRAPGSEGRPHGIAVRHKTP